MVYLGVDLHRKGSVVTALRRQTGLQTSPVRGRRRASTSQADVGDPVEERRGLVGFGFQLLELGHPAAVEARGPFSTP
jgi:hypothetical protein